MMEPYINESDGNINDPIVDDENLHLYDGLKSPSADDSEDEEGGGNNNHTVNSEASDSDINDEDDNGEGHGEEGSKSDSSEIEEEESEILDSDDKTVEDGTIDKNTGLYVYSYRPNDVASQSQDSESDEDLTHNNYYEDDEPSRISTLSRLSSISLKTSFSTKAMTKVTRRYYKRWLRPSKPSRITTLEWYGVACSVFGIWCLWFYILHLIHLQAFPNSESVNVTKLESGSDSASDIVQTATVEKDSENLDFKSDPDSVTLSFDTLKLDSISDSFITIRSILIKYYMQVLATLTESPYIDLINPTKFLQRFPNLTFPSPILSLYKQIHRESHDQMALWDHPEANFVWSPACAEFWSVITALPIASSMLLYLSFRLNYSYKVKALYLTSLWMYTCASHAHFFLHKNMFEVTLSSVMFAAITTFYLYSHIAPHATIDYCCKCASKLAKVTSIYGRVGITVVFMGIVVWSARTLPGLWTDVISSGAGEEMTQASGGVWTLFIVQTPPVLIASTMALFLYKETKNPALKLPLGWLAFAGSLLSLAMLLSLIETQFGLTEWNNIDMEVVFWRVVRKVRGWRVGRIVWMFLTVLGGQVGRIGAAESDESSDNNNSHGGQVGNIHSNQDSENSDSSDADSESSSSSESSKLFILPLLHITIHILEQCGIYIYSMAVAILHHGFLERECNRRAVMHYTGNSEGLLASQNMLGAGSLKGVSGAKVYKKGSLGRRSNTNSIKSESNRKSLTKSTKTMRQNLKNQNQIHPIPEENISEVNLAQTDALNHNDDLNSAQNDAQNQIDSEDVTTSSSPFRPKQYLLSLLSFTKFLFSTFILQPLKSLSSLLHTLLISTLFHSILLPLLSALLTCLSWVFRMPYCDFEEVESDEARNQILEYWREHDSKMKSCKLRNETLEKVTGSINMDISDSVLVNSESDGCGCGPVADSDVNSLNPYIKESETATVTESDDNVPTSKLLDSMPSDYDAYYPQDFDSQNQNLDSLSTHYTSSDNVTNTSSNISSTSNSPNLGESEDNFRE